LSDPGETELRHDKGGNLLVPVTINGRSDWAVMDTGAEHTDMSWAFAARVGINRTTFGIEPAGWVGGIGKHAVKQYRLTLPKIQIGSEIIEHLSVYIYDDPPDGPSDDSLLIGMDFFEKNRVYLSGRENKMYFVPYRSGMPERQLISFE
jgi:predicted aspartyl protease